MPIAQVFVDGGSTLGETEIIFALVSQVEIFHGYQHRPKVLITDQNGNVIGADIRHTDENTILVTFCQTLSGYIYLR